LLFASSVVRAAPVEGEDILVIDQGANKLVRIDGRNGVRSVVSDFSNSAQGPTNGPNPLLTGVAIRGQIFVTDGHAGIFAVDPHNGHRFLVSNFNRGAIRGSVGIGVAVDVFGAIIATVHTGPDALSDSAVVRVAPRTDNRTIITEVPYDGGEIITDLTLEHVTPTHHPGAILIATANLNLNVPSAIYRVDPVTGRQSLLSDFSNPAQGTTAADLIASTGLAVEHGGTILANTGGPGFRDLLLRIDPVSGNRTILSDFDDPSQGPVGAFLYGAAVQRSGYIFVIATNLTGSDNLYRVDPRTGRRVVFSDSANPKQGASLKFPMYAAAVPCNAGFFARPPAGSFATPFGTAK
jgi:hypothetical protein